MRFVFTLISMLFVLASLANPLDSVRTENRTDGQFVVHEVEEKETIYSIARRYKGTVDGIIEHNQILDNRIEIGQVLYILIVNEKQSKQPTLVVPNRTDIHVVKQGETLYSISKMHDVKLKELRRWNNLPNNDISPGMQLRLSKKAKISDMPEPSHAMDSVSNAN
ncbi:MAG: LysM peptidoglycan-binding domain-containing protein, partial [Bacteroidota bacterium]